MIHLPKDFPKFQTVAWWKQQLDAYDDKLVVALYTGPGEEPICLLSDYVENGILCIDIGLEELE